MEESGIQAALWRKTEARQLVWKGQELKSGCVPEMKGQRAVARKS